ncbi:uncharacterized protein LOC112126468 [Cimex lectularius]|uniref:Uncharacterized protein n=1 Tax=Cimex lectularius TaxID=79782 RepID=A0A8I6SSD6_CIMLE|nr:uncharacterized protein LOC112126468 [Cimex lectularius]
MPLGAEDVAHGAALIDHVPSGMRLLPSEFSTKLCETPLDVFEKLSPVIECPVLGDLGTELQDDRFLTSKKIFLSSKTIQCASSSMQRVRRTKGIKCRGVITVMAAVSRSSRVRKKAPCMPKTPEEARVVVWKTSGEALGEAKAKLAMLVKATQASATTPEQRSCAGRKVGFAFQDAKMRVHHCSLVQFGHDHGMDVAFTDVETARKVVTEELSKVVNSVVKDNEQLFKQCLA